MFEYYYDSEVIELPTLTSASRPRSALPCFSFDLQTIVGRVSRYTLRVTYDEAVLTSTTACSSRSLHQRCW